MSPFVSNQLSLVLAIVGAGLAVQPVPILAQSLPIVRVAELPQLLRDQWRGMAAEMNENSRCAAAFDGASDASRMILKCSIHIRSASEGARRAMRYCEDDRQRLGVRSACRIVQA